MKLREVFRYEVAYRLRSPSTWVYAVFLFLIAFLMIHAQADADNAVRANAPEHIARFGLMAGMVGMLVSAALFGETTIRDAESGMDPLLFTTPISKTEYLGGRFLAALSINAVILLALPLGSAIATLMPYLEREAFGPFRLAAYVQGYVLFILPNLFITGAILFAIAALVRQAIPVYLGALLIFVGYVVAMNLLIGVKDPLLAALGDTIGAGTLNRLTEYRPPAERNSLLVGFPAPLVLNRVVWIAIAAGILVALHRRFRFEHAGARSARALPSPVTKGGVNTATATAQSRFAVRMTPALDIARQSFAEVAGNKWFVILLVGLVGFTMLFGWESNQSVFDTSTWPVTVYMVERLLDTPLYPLTFLLIAIFAGELVWKNRNVGVAEIADAAPVSEGAVVAGKFLALAAVLTLIQLTIIVGGVLAQAFQGYYNFELELYLKLILGMRLPGVLLLAMLAMAIHVVVNHKYVAHLVVVIACMAPIVLNQAGVIQHRLLVYGGDPGWTYSDMNGFGAFVRPFIVFKLYWAAWAILIGVATALLWVRGRESGVKARLAQARARWNGSISRVSALAMLLIVTLGGFAFYNTNVLNEYHNAGSAGEERAEYEKRYGRYEMIAQPIIVDARLRVEVRPEHPAVEISGSYGLVNRTTKAIDSVHVYVDPDIAITSLSIPAAKLAHEDREIGYRIFALARALQPGDSVRLAFDVAFRPRGFPNEGVQTSVVRNGAFFHRLWTPFVGYQPFFELSDAEIRARFGLPPQPPMPGPGDPNASRWSLRDADLVHVDATIGTVEGQTAITPGMLKRTWTENGRSYFHYVTDAPISFGGTVFSGEYAVASDKWKDIDLAVFHHPGHGYNVDRMLRSMKASLEYFTTQFGPYPYSQLRIVETPRYGGFGSAHPQTIAFVEDAFLSRVREGEIDLPFYGTAHEVAHTWWGGMVRGAAVRGHGLLTESLANYSAMMVTEKTFGEETGRRVYQFQKGRYLTGRSAQSREVPLLEVSGQPYIEYRKGAIALYRLRHEIGEAAMSSALRSYFAKHVDAKPPYPTSLGLYAELRAVTPDSVKPLLVDLFETITLWDVKAERVTFAKQPSGGYEATLEVVAKKVRADSLGGETEVAMDEWVDIGAFASADPDSLGPPLYLRRHRIRSGRQTLRFRVSGEPRLAGIDPHRWLIDRNGSDNIK